MNFKDWIEKNRNWQIELGQRLGNKSGGITTEKKQTAFVDRTERVIKKCDMPDVGQSLKCLMEDDKPTCNCKLNECIKKGW
jgi:hypothetical protein